MRYAIFSDIHSNLEALEAVLEAYQKEGIDKYLCIGDVVGYGADPQTCIDKVNSVAMITVAGNHDWAVVDLFPPDNFNPLPKEAIFWTKKHLPENGKAFLRALKLIYVIENFVLVHGSLDNPQNFNYLTNVCDCAASFELLKSNVCFIGHTHVPGIFIQDKQGNSYYENQDYIEIEPQNKYIINVGSVGQPRDSNPAAVYCIYDTDKKQVQIKRIDYDVQTARKKIIEAGLPRFLGDRLILRK